MVPALLEGHGTDTNLDDFAVNQAQPCHVFWRLIHGQVESSTSMVNPVTISPSRSPLSLTGGWPSFHAVYLHKK